MRSRGWVGILEEMMREGWGLVKEGGRGLVIKRKNTACKIC